MKYEAISEINIEYLLFFKKPNKLLFTKAPNKYMLYYYSPLIVKGKPNIVYWSYSYLKI